MCLCFVLSVWSIYKGIKKMGTKPVRRGPLVSILQQ